MVYLLASMQLADHLPSDALRRNDILAGLTKVLPLVLGYVPIGFAFGLLARGAGLSAANILLMSLLVYAASSQILAVQLLAAGASPLSVVVATLVVNLRHLLMSSALAKHLRHLRRPELAAFMFHLTDETFALHSNEYAARRPSRLESFVVNVTLHAGWMAGTAAALVTEASPDILTRLGLDFAPSAMFIAVLVLIVKDRLELAVAALCGGLAIGLARLGLGPWGIIIATVVGATAGLAWETCSNRPSSSPSSG